MNELYSVAMIVSIATFTLSTVLTPGPNNIMLLSSGLTFGYKKTLPHILGIIFGFPFMVILVGLGMGVVFENYPFLFQIVKVIGILYLFWLAYKIANSADNYDTTIKSKPLTFLEAAAFQWLNPKGWIMAITSVSVFVTSSQNYFMQVVFVSFIYFLSGMISTNSWTLGGVLLKKFIKSEKSIGIFNKLMALLLVLSIIPFI